MKNYTLPQFFEILSSKIMNCFLPKNTDSKLDFFKLENDIRIDFLDELVKIKNNLLSFVHLSLAKMGSRFLLSFRNLLLFILLSFAGLSTAVAQTTTTFPSPDRCTSKDLELVSATLTGGDACNSCTPGTTLTRTLTLSINNKTGSMRTAFAFWGKLEITHADGTVVNTTISKCSDISPIPPTGPLPAVYTGGNFGTITYQCGDALRLIDLYLAWTDASPKSTCSSINSATISPKCGTLHSIQINVGVNGSFAITHVICFGASTGAIVLTPSGGTGPYIFDWSDVVGSNNSKDRTNLAAGTYTVTITDSKNCSITKIAIIIGPSVGLALGTCSKTDVSCSGGDGTVTAGAVSNAIGTVHYSWKNSSNVVVGTTSSVSSLSADTYTLTVSDDCSSITCAVTVAEPPSISKPAATVTQPTCTTATGTVTITSPATDVTYELKQAGVVKYTAVNGVFSSVVSGTYNFIATKGICSKAGDDVTVNAQPGTPAAPSLKITQPSLCGSSTFGSIEVCNPVVGYTYKLYLGTAITPSDTNTFASGLLIFGNLAAGSNPSVTATTIGGCTSAGTNCSSATLTCSSPNAKTTETVAPNKTVITSKTELVGFDAYPVPFKNQLTIRYKFDYESNVKIEVLNTIGKVVYSKSDSNGYLNKEYTLNLNTSKSQMYLVKLTTDKGSSIKKVLSSQ